MPGRSFPAASLGGRRRPPGAWVPTALNRYPDRGLIEPEQETRPERQQPRRNREIRASIRLRIRSQPWGKVTTPGASSTPACPTKPPESRTTGEVGERRGQVISSQCVSNQSRRHFGRARLPDDLSVCAELL